MGHICPAKTFVFFNIFNYQRGFIDDGVFGDAGIKIDAVAGFNVFSQTDGGFENKSGGNYSGQQRSRPHEQNFSDATPWDPYRILGIDRSASAVEIKQAYRELARKYHPDKLEHLGDEFKELAEIRFKEIQKAYQELSGKV